MGRLAATALALALLAPGSAAALDPPDCARRIREYQLQRDMLARADASGKKIWIEGMENQLGLLESRLDTRCPEYTAEKRALRNAARQMAELVKAAGKAALTFFTMGAF